jgi:hypothetical protein
MKSSAWRQLPSVRAQVAVAQIDQRMLKDNELSASAVRTRSPAEQLLAFDPIIGLLSEFVDSSQNHGR